MIQTLANIERGEKMEFNYEFFEDTIQRKQLANTKGLLGCKDCQT